MVWMKVFSACASQQMWLDTNTISPTVTSCVRSVWTQDLSSTGPYRRPVLSLLLEAVSLLLIGWCSEEKVLCVYVLSWVIFLMWWAHLLLYKVKLTLNWAFRNPNPYTEVWKEALRCWTPHCWLWCKSAHSNILILLSSYIICFPCEE